MTRLDVAEHRTTAANPRTSRLSVVLQSLDGDEISELSDLMDRSTSISEERSSNSAAESALYDGSVNEAYASLSAGDETAWVH
jgi:hypothetical protein